MKYAYKIYNRRRLIVYRVVGKPDRESVAAMYRALVNDPHYSTEFAGVADWRGVTSHLTREDVAYIAELVMSDNKLQQLWIGLVSVPMSTALATIYGQKVSGQHAVKVCSTPEGASEILGYDVGPYLLQRPE